MNKQSGFILLTSIVLLGIIALLLLESQAQLTVIQKSLNSLVGFDDNYYQMKSIANDLIIKKAWQKNTCFMQTTNPNFILDLLRKKSGCVVYDKNETYFYSLVDLGPYPCVQIHQNERYSTQHYLMSLYSSIEKTFLQIRFALPIPLVSCEKNVILVHRLIPLSERTLKG